VEAAARRAAVESDGMTKASAIRYAEHEIDPLFLDRWSPRAMSGDPVDSAELMVLFEAARWAPSSGNAQPWRILFARRDGPHWPTFLDLLTDSNRVWARHAAALVLFISKSVNDAGKPSITHSFDTGAAWENLALQGGLKGLVVHGMQGFDYGRARVALAIPEEFRVEAMAAIGRPAPAESLPDHLRARETPSSRRPLAETVCEGPFRL
jgi:nitroreductase